MYRFIFYAVLVMLFIFLIAIPLGYCIRKGNFKRGLFFTWIAWAIVWFIYGFCLPAFCVVIENVTGKPCDITCATMFVGISVGWLPGIIFGLIGKAIHGTETKIPDVLEEKK
jgi:hypothetical protein